VAGCLGFVGWDFWWYFVSSLFARLFANAGHLPKRTDLLQFDALKGFIFGFYHSILIAQAHFLLRRVEKCFCVGYEGCELCGGVATYQNRLFL